MAVELVDFKTISPAQRAMAADVLRTALAHLPSGYQGPGEAAAEVELRRNEDDWLGYAALEDTRLSAGSAPSAPTATAGSSIRSSSRPIGSVTASARRC